LPLILITTEKSVCLSSVKYMPLNISQTSPVRE
jgi:hypothetical protein